MKIAIQPDSIDPRGTQPPMSHAQRWIQHANELGIETKVVDVTSKTVFDSLHDCDGLMWRFNASSPYETEVARNILLPTSTILGIPTYPAPQVVMSVDDKIAQDYAIHAAGLPQPESFVFYDFHAAIAFLERADYPLVAKLRSGAGSVNVLLLRNVEQGKRLAKHLFSTGLGEAWQAATSTTRTWARLARQIGKGALNKSPVKRWHAGYMYLQKFLPGNKYDIRATVIGERVFVFRRFNRDGDFRASGSGKIDHTRFEFSRSAANLGRAAAKALQMNVAAFDFLIQNDDLFIIEVNSDFLVSAVEQCQGHWVFHDDGNAAWHESEVDVDSLIFDVFIREARQHHAVRSTKTEGQFTESAEEQ